MGFLTFYLIALLPVVIGGVLWVTRREMHHWEWLGGTAAAFTVAGAMHGAAVSSMTADTEVWSGEVTHVRFRPEWRERYTVTHTTTTTNSDGSTSTQTYTTTHYTTHPDKWYAHTTLHQELDISAARYREIGSNFGGESTKKRGVRSTWRESSTVVGGDPYDYLVYNRSRHIEPVIRGVSFSNRVKATPSVFSYRKLSEEEASALPDYPEARNVWRSDRVIGAPVSIRLWDEMMAKLGPEKKVNLILVRLPSQTDATDLEAKWIGGKKNDLVLCYGTGWSYVFGWTEQEMVKRTLETLLLGDVGDSMLPEIEAIVREHYELVDWSKFGYLSLEPRRVHYVILLLVMVLTQAGLHWYFLLNDLDK